MHHHPVGGAPANSRSAIAPMAEQLRRTVIDWKFVAKPGEQCVLWDLDNHVGVDEPWGVDLARVAEIQPAVTKLRPSARNSRRVVCPRPAVRSDR